MSGEIQRIEEIPDTEMNTTQPNRQTFSCSICEVKVSSSRIFQRHLEGRKHRARIENKGKIFRCELCNLNANSKNQLEKHLKGSKHQMALERIERAQFVGTKSNAHMWILVICAGCVFLNFFILFKLYL